jgi:hypothetical protein
VGGIFAFNKELDEYSAVLASKITAVCPTSD